MVKQQTSPVADPSPTRMAEKGFTLFEMMVALAVIALATSVVTLMVLPRQGERALDAASVGLMRNLQAAQLVARDTGRPVVVDVTAYGYRIAATDTEVNWPDGWQVDWARMGPSGWQTVDRLRLSGATLSREAARIELRSGGRSRIVSVERMTGRVSLG